MPRAGEPPPRVWPKRRLLCEANAVVDVKMRTTNIGAASSMDYTLVGTAVKVEGLSPSRDPIIATVSALEFARLLEAGIVPVGLAIGAHYEWLQGGMYDLEGGWSANNRPLPDLGRFLGKCTPRRPQRPAP